MRSWEDFACGKNQAVDDFAHNYNSESADDPFHPNLDSDRVKAGALDRLGIYLHRDSRQAVTSLVSKRLSPNLVECAAASLQASGIAMTSWTEVEDKRHVDAESGHFLNRMR